jgi:hypothetical protein
MRALLLAGVAVASLAATPDHALAWGDDGHKVVALIADHFMTPAVRTKVHAMLGRHRHSDRP